MGHIAPSAAHGCRLKLLKPATWSTSGLIRALCAHASISGKQVRSLLGLVVPRAWQRESQALIQEWDFWNSACATLHTGNSWLLQARWVSGVPGTRAQPSPSLPRLAGEPRVCKCHEGFFEAAGIFLLLLLSWFYFSCHWRAEYGWTSNAGING